jgi:hypothetical protein
LYREDKTSENSTGWNKTSENSACWNKTSENSTCWNKTSLGLKIYKGSLVFFLFCYFDNKTAICFVGVQDDKPSANIF